MNCFRGNLVRTLVILFGYLVCNSAFAQTINGSISFLNVHNTTQVNIVDGAHVSFLDAFDQSHVDVKGGNISWLNLHDKATASIFGGDISWIQAYDRSFVRLTGIDDLSWLVFRGTESRAEIVGSNVSYSNGHLSGVWANGTSFSFWAVQDGAITSTIPSNIFITSIPEPNTLLLLAVGFSFVLMRVRQRTEYA